MLAPGQASLPPPVAGWGIGSRPTSAPLALTSANVASLILVFSFIFWTRRGLIPKRLSHLPKSPRSSGISCLRFLASLRARSDLRPTARVQPDASKRKPIRIFFPSVHKIRPTSFLKLCLLLPRKPFVRHRLRLHLKSKVATNWAH